MSSGGPRPDEASLASSLSPSLGAGGETLVVLCFFDRVVGVNTGVDLVHRTIRSADLLLMYLGARGTLAQEGRKRWIRQPSWPQRLLT